MGPGETITWGDPPITFLSNRHCLLFILTETQSLLDAGLTAMLRLYYKGFNNSK